MKVDAILMADAHLRDSQPSSRTDDFFKTMIGKINWIAELQQEYNCPVLNAGDLFHQWKASPYLLAAVMNILPDQFYTIAGNHDLPNHNIDLLEKSGLNVLWQAGVINPEAQKHYTINAFHYGDTIKGSGDILMCHEMIYQSPEHWQKENGSQALAFLKKHKDYQLIVTGHNHKPFTAQHRGRLLVNPGSLMRDNISQVDYKPRVYLWNKESNTVQIKYIPINKDVFQYDQYVKDKKHDEKMQAYIDAMPSLSSGKDTTADLISFQKNFETYFANNRVRTSVKDIINECTGGAI